MINACEEPAWIIANSLKYIYMILLLHFVNICPILACLPVLPKADKCTTHQAIAQEMRHPDHSVERRKRGKPVER